MEYKFQMGSCGKEAKNQAEACTPMLLEKQSDVQNKPNLSADK